MPLTGKTALITGCSAPRGIGRAIAKRLAHDGAKVVVSDLLSDKNQTLLADLATEINATGGQATATALDVTNAGDITKITTKFTPIDILVNNAGSLAGADNFLATTPAEWQTSFAVNILGPMQLSQAVLPNMQARKFGRIINIGSTASLGAEAGFGAYTTMKHGLVGMTKTMAAEFGVDGITCNLVCPGYINTDMHAAANARLAAENNLTIPEMKAQRYASVALRDAGDPSNVADAVAFLAGPQGAYITGINLPVSGGVPFGI